MPEAEAAAADVPASASFLQYASDYGGGGGGSDGACGGGKALPPPTVIIVGDGRSRVRKVVRTTTRHVTVVSYSSRHKESSTHTSHHVTTVR